MVRYRDKRHIFSVVEYFWHFLVLFFQAFRLRLQLLAGMGPRGTGPTI